MSEYIPFILPSTKNTKNIEAQKPAKVAKVPFSEPEKTVCTSNDVDTSPPVTLAKSALKFAKVAKVDDTPSLSKTYVCQCCHETRRWRSVYGVIICGTCHPPRNAALVEAWLEADEP